MKNNKLLYLKWISVLTVLLMYSVGSYAQVNNYDIYVYDVLKGTYRQVSSIADQGEYNPSWSPNSKKIAHESVRPDGYQQIYITDVETGISTILQGGEEGNDAAWSSDGKKIMFDKSWTYIYCVPAEGVTPTLLWDGGVEAEWSPNSKYIVFWDWISMSMITMNLADGTQTTLCYTGENPDWSPNGQYIAYDDWAYGGIWIIEVNPKGEPVGDPIQLTTTGGQPSWSNNSKTIIYSDAPDAPPGTWPADIYSISIDGATPVKVCGFEAINGLDFGDYDPCVSNNGKYIAFPAYTDPNMMPILQPVSKSMLAAPVIGSRKIDDLKVGIKTNPGNRDVELNFQTMSSEKISIRILDSKGRLLLSQSDIPANSAYTVGRNLGKGVYVVEIRQGTQRKVIKLLNPTCAL